MWKVTNQYHVNKPRQRKTVRECLCLLILSFYLHCIILLFLFYCSDVALPVLKGTKRISGSHGVQELCVLSLLYVVVADFDTKLSLFKMLPSSDTLKLLNTISCKKVHGLAAVAEDKIAVTRSSVKHIEFFDICQNKIKKSKKEIFLDGHCWGINYQNQCLFVVTSDPNEILQIDLQQNVMRSYKLPQAMLYARICYHSNTKTVYVSNPTRVYAITLEGHTSVAIRKVPGISHIAVKDNCNLYVTCSSGLYLVNITTGEAYNVLEGNNSCIFYHSRQKQLYFADKNIIYIFETGK